MKDCELMRRDVTKFGAACLQIGILTAISFAADVSNKEVVFVRRSSVTTGSSSTSGVFTKGSSIYGGSSTSGEMTETVFTKGSSIYGGSSTSGEMTETVTVTTSYSETTYMMEESIDQMKQTALETINKLRKSLNLGEVKLSETLCSAAKDSITICKAFGQGGDNHRIFFGRHLKGSECIELSFKHKDSMFKLTSITKFGIARCQFGEQYGIYIAIDDGTRKENFNKEMKKITAAINTERKKAGYTDIEVDSKLTEEANVMAKQLLYDPKFKCQAYQGFLGYSLKGLDCVQNSLQMQGSELMIQNVKHYGAACCQIGIMTAIYFTTGSSTSGGLSETESIEEMKKLALAKINELRQRSGLSLLGIDETLCKIATETVSICSTYRKDDYEGDKYRIFFGVHLTGATCIEESFNHDNSILKSENIKTFGIGRNTFPYGFGIYIVIDDDSEKEDFDSKIAEITNAINEKRKTLYLDDISLDLQLTEKARHRAEQLLYNPLFKCQKYQGCLGYSLKALTCTMKCLKTVGCELMQQTVKKYGVARVMVGSLVAIYFFTDIPELIAPIKKSTAHESLLPNCPITRSASRLGTQHNYKGQFSGATKSSKLENCAITKGHAANENADKN